MSSHTRSRRGSAGQALVETALILPLFLTLLLGIVDMGRAVWATTSLASAAREAARYAIVHGGTAAIVQMGGTSGGAGGSSVDVTLQFISWDLTFNGNISFHFFYQSDAFAKAMDYGLIK
jgi:TadE-like protein